MFIGPVTLISVGYWGHITPKYNFTAILMYTIPLESDSPNFKPTKAFIPQQQI